MGYLPQTSKEVKIGPGRKRKFFLLARVGEVGWRSGSENLEILK